MHKLVPKHAEPAGVGVEEEVLWFDVSVADSEAVDVGQ